MAKYRHRPTEVEAEQFHGFYGTPYPPGVEFEDNSNVPGKERYLFYVVTIHGQKTYVAAGDWIIAEPDGEHYYPCKDEVFRANYEKAE